jgi:hypothetical protein
MLSRVNRWSIAIATSGAGLILLLAAEPAHAQAMLQARQTTRCPNRGSQAQVNSRQQSNRLRYALKIQQRQLNALQQTGQLTPAQVQAASQLAIKAQDALLQLAALQNASFTLAQLQMLGQQQLAIALQLRALQPLSSP